DRTLRRRGIRRRAARYVASDHAGLVEGHARSIQRRLHRRHPNKTEVRIYDYVDVNVPVLLRMFEKRLATYRAIGYARGEAPLGMVEPLEERIIECDVEGGEPFEA